MEKRAQGALEYLVMMGVALVLIAVVVGIILPSIARQKCENAIKQLDSICSTNYPTQNLCDGTSSTVTWPGATNTLYCRWDASRGYCVLDASSKGDVPECQGFY